MTETDVAGIVKGLTPSMQDALHGVYSWSDPIEQEQGEAELYRLGLWSGEKDRRKGPITMLGLAVRAFLEKERVG